LLFVILVCLWVGSVSAQTAYALLVSTSSNRSSPVPLDGTTVSGRIYVFVSPQTEIARARFFVDDPTMTGEPYGTDVAAPYDLAGTGAKGRALPFDTAQLTDGPHTVTAAVELVSGGTVLTSSDVTVVNGSSPPPSIHSLEVSSSPSRSSPGPLQDLTVTGEVYVFLAPDTGAQRVQFYVDDPGMTGIAFSTDTRAPWDLAGTAKNSTARPFDTTQLLDGPHQVTASVDLSTGEIEVVTSSFLVANFGPSLTLTPGSMSFAVASGQTASQALTVGATDGTTSFTVSDDEPWLSVSPGSGATPATLTATIDSTGLSGGTFSATISATAPGHTAAQATVSLSVGTGSVGADQVHLAWVEDPATTLTVVWRTLDPAAPSAVQFRPTGTSTWQTVEGAVRPSGTAGALHETTLRSLTPSSGYEYRVAAGGSSWSEVFSTRTAPPSGPATFDVVYVADTGIAGRTDGLTTGTLGVIDAIRQLDPLVVLLGGDYAYFDTETRFPTLDDAIDAWFNQMQPISTRAPMMVGYGNHEVLLGEGFAPWAARFPTPPGVDGGRSYSFDVGDAHFISIFAVTGNGGLSSSTLLWIEQDILAAKSQGARWIIPFFHVSPFADGIVHPSNLQLRAQLGPLFEDLDVDMAISSHDQSYERTFPLTDVPATNAPTSTAESCYGPQEGVIWMKVSPGGKLSNVNGDFSTFTTDPPPRWTAARDDSMHHFVRLRFSSTGSIHVEVLGIEADGAPVTLIDDFTYTLGTCPPELYFDAENAILAGRQGGLAVTHQVALDALGGSASYAISEQAPWLSVQPTVGMTPASLTLTADPAGLTPGPYRTTVTAAATGHAPDQITVTFWVTASYELVASSAADRSAPTPLEGNTLSGDVYVFVRPDVGVARVRFFVDDPSMSGTPSKVESNAPWDLGGTAPNGLALPFDTSRLSNGPHSLTVLIELVTGATETSTTGFSVAN
jgi:hypothetical protein